MQEVDRGIAEGLIEQAPEDELLALCHLLGHVGDSLLIFISPSSFPSLEKDGKK